jgi:hypothetical protein
MNRKRLLIVVGVAMTAAAVAEILLDRRVMSTGGPGIIGFEFAATKARAAQILAEWGPKGRDAARASLIVDYAYMVTYGAFFTLAGLAVRDLARTRSWRRLAAAGTILPFFAAAAAGFDAVENLFLLLVLEGEGGGHAPTIATVCSTIKFTLITTAILYVLCGLALRVRRRPRTVG